MQVESIGGHKYFATFTDDFSHCCAVYFLKQKSDVVEKFKEFEAVVTNECGHGIVKLLTIAHSPQQNGTAERVNRTLLESARAMMLHAKLANQYWAEAVATAAYLKN